MKHLLKMSDLTPAEVAHILDVADELKARQKAGGTEPLLKGKSVALMFSKNSTRTRTSFEVGVYQLGGLGNYMNAAVEASDSTDKFKSTLDFAGVDTETIDRLTKSTQAYADATVYDLADIRNVTAQLAANGVKDYDKLAEAAGNLNAVAGGNAETFKSVGMVLTQTAGQGKLTTENFNQLSDAIPGASGKIQQALRDMGAYTGNFRDAMEKGEISAEEFDQALMELGMTDAAVEAAKSAKTFEGAVGNWDAAVQKLITKGLDAVKPAFTKALGGATDIVSDFTDDISDNLDDLQKRFSKAADSLLKGNLAQAIGDYDSVEIVNELKLILNETKDMTDGELRAKIKEIAAEYNVTLTDDQMTQLVNLCRSLEKLDTNALLSKVQAVQDTLKQLAGAKDKVASFTGKVKDVITAIGNFFDRVIAFFRK